MENRGRIRVETGLKRVRVYLGGDVVADTKQPRLVWEIPNYPAYYFPVADVRMDLLAANGNTSHSPSRGDAQLYDVKGGLRTAVDGAWRYPDSPIDELRELVRFDWSAMDHWFEEDEEVIVHPRSPYVRVDILASSRHVRVEMNGETVAEHDHPHLLFETGLPVRYYLPLTAVRHELLRASDTVTQCPYKGTATYWSVMAGGELVPDAVWTYKTPLPECQKVAGLVSFFNERVDLYVDGELQERPRTPFSRR